MVNVFSVDTKHGNGIFKIDYLKLLQNRKGQVGHTVQNHQWMIEKFFISELSL